MGSFSCVGYYSPIHWTDGLKSPLKDLAMRISALPKGATAGPGLNWGPSVWKSEVLTAQPYM